MVCNRKNIFKWSMDHYVVVCIFIAVFIFSWIGVGNITIVGMAGLILCMAGMVQEPGNGDIWIFVPLVIYNLISMVSSYVALGNLVVGYASTQMIFPVMYLLMMCLKEKELFLLRQLCAGWAGSVAVIGIIQFIYRAVTGSGTGRLNGILGNPNAMGIFLVIGWFALMDCTLEDNDYTAVSFPYIEPFLLIALALTLSIGSFAAMAGGIFVLLAGRLRQASEQDIFLYGCCLLSKAGFGIGIGIFIYLAADRSQMAWICIPLTLYALIVVINWRRFDRFLKEKRKMAVIIASFSILIGILAIAVRPNSIATFSERLEMIRNGIHYLTVNPVFGVGPYHWRVLNLYDSDKYFNTYHIHNVFVHVGVEIGWISMAMLILITLRIYQKKKSLVQKAGFTAFLIHNMMDTSFFYIGITAMMMLTTAGFDSSGKKLHRVVTRMIFGVFALLFVYNLYYVHS